MVRLFYTIELFDLVALLNQLSSLTYNHKRGPWFQSCDDSDDKAEDSELKIPGFKPWRWQEKIKNISSSFLLVALEPMRSTSRFCPIAANMHDNKQS